MAAPTPPHAPMQAEVMDAKWAGGFIIGAFVGVAVGIGLAILAAALWYHGHCAQLPLLGGVYCTGNGVPMP